MQHFVKRNKSTAVSYLVLVDGLSELLGIRRQTLVRVGELTAFDARRRGLDLQATTVNE
jgi:hypothetical protein